MNLLTFLKNPVSASELLDIVDQTVIENEDKIVKVQKEQWKKGEDKNGNLFPPYSPLTEILSGGRKKAGQPWNLFDTGSFYKKTSAESKKQSNDLTIKIDSSDSKTGLLESKIGNRIFGIQPNNGGKVIRLINRQSLIKLKKRYGM